MDAQDSPLQALKKSLKLFITADMLMLTLYFYYTGMLLSFWSVVYGTSLSRTLKFDDPKGMVGLHGIFVGVGEILGGAIFGIFGSAQARWPCHFRNIENLWACTCGVDHRCKRCGQVAQSSKWASS